MPCFHVVAGRASVREQRTYVCIMIIAGERGIKLSSGQNCVECGKRRRRRDGCAPVASPSRRAPRRQRETSGPPSYDQWPPAKNPFSPRRPLRATAKMRARFSASGGGEEAPCTP